MTRKPYAAYSAEELALDDLFVRWVQHPDDEEVAAYWQKWLTNQPQCAQTAETARSLILNASLPATLPLTGDEVSTVWGRIRESLQTMEDVKPLQPDVRAMVGWWYFLRTVAATLGLALLIGWALWMQYGPDQTIRTIKTDPGQTRIIRLPIIQLLNYMLIVQYGTRADGPMNRRGPFGYKVRPTSPSFTVPIPLRRSYFGCIRPI